jgi:hypothetical protein
MALGQAVGRHLTAVIGVRESPPEHAGLESAES